MAIYRSIFTGQQIDEMLSLLKDKGLDNVIGIVERDSEGNFIAADISWIPDISETVSSIDYDPINTKITKTINGTTSDVVSVATLKTDFGVGQADGIVPLNSSRKIDATYLPSYVDDIIEGYYYNNKFYEESTHTTEIVGEGGKIYIDLTTNRTYRWGGSTYAEVSPGTVITVVRDLVTGTKTATITVDGVGYDLYAPTISLNGSSTTSASFYAPTSAGTDGYVLKSNGSGAPTWTSAVLTDEKLSVAEVTSGSTYYPIVGSGTSAATRQIDSTGFSYSGTDGTANNSSNGKAFLTLGNSTSYTTAGWKQGLIRLYGCKSGYTDIRAYSFHNYSNTVDLPTSSGTLALTNQIVYPGDIWIYGHDDGNGYITYEGPTYDEAMNQIMSNKKTIRCYYGTTTPDPEDESSFIYSGDISIYYLSYYDFNYADDIVFINTTNNNGNLTYSIITINHESDITMSTASGGGGSSTEIIRWTED